MNVCTYVFIYVCTYASIYVCIHTCILPCVDIRMCLRMHVSTYVYIYVCVYIYIYTLCVCVYWCMHVWTYVSIYVCTYGCTYACMHAGLCIYVEATGRARGTTVAQWLRCCATIQKVAFSIPAGVSGSFIDIKSFRSHYGPGIDSASNRNEYQEYFLGVKVTGA